MRKLRILFALYFLQQVFSSTYYTPAMCSLGKARLLPSRTLLCSRQRQIHLWVHLERVVSLCSQERLPGGRGSQVGLLGPEVSNANRGAGYSVKRRTWRESSWWSGQQGFGPNCHDAWPLPVRGGAPGSSCLCTGEFNTCLHPPAQPPFPSVQKCVSTRLV